jgi:hypothetical protein
VHSLLSSLPNSLLYSRRCNHRPSRAISRRGSPQNSLQVSLPCSLQ